MPLVTNWLLRRWVPDHDEVLRREVRTRYGVLEGWLSIIVNTLLFAVKLTMGLLVGSGALIADAVHSLSDSFSSAVVVIGFRIAGKDPDTEHPFGHGRVENVLALIVAVLLMVTAFEFARAGWDRLFVSPPSSELSYWVIGVILATIALKEWLTRVARNLGERIGSAALEADAWHHRSDALSSVLVIVALVATDLGVPWADAACTIGVALFIFWTGIVLVRGVSDPIVGAAPDPALLRRIRTQAHEIAGVLGVHDIIVHDYGHRPAISLHVEVAEDTTLLKAHEIAEEVEESLAKSLAAISVVVHADPVLAKSAENDELFAAVERQVRAFAEGADFHDVRLIGHPGHQVLLFDLSWEEARDENLSQRIVAQVAEVLERELAPLKVRILVDPVHHYNPPPTA